jgi:hypothetical protein
MKHEVCSTDQQSGYGRRQDMRKSRSKCPYLNLKGVHVKEYIDDGIMQNLLHLVPRSHIGMYMIIQTFLPASH